MRIFVTHNCKVLFVNYLSCRFFYISIIIYYVNKIKSIDYYFTLQTRIMLQSCEFVNFAIICSFLHSTNGLNIFLSRIPSRLFLYYIASSVFNSSSRLKKHWRINWMDKHVWISFLWRKRERILRTSLNNSSLKQTLFRINGDQLS